MLYDLDGKQPELKDETVWVAPSADVIGDVVLEKGASVWFNVTIRGDNEQMYIGQNTNIQDNSVLHSDPGMPLRVGEGVTVGHKVMLHGCTIGDHSLIGMGSTILNGAKVGKNCIVGANSLITEGKEFPDGVLVVGSPARVARELKEHEIAMIKASERIYAENAARFAQKLTPVKTTGS